MIEISILENEDADCCIPEHYGFYDTPEEAIAALKELEEELAQ